MPDRMSYFCSMRYSRVILLRLRRKTCGRDKRAGRSVGVGRFKKAKSHLLGSEDRKLYRPFCGFELSNSSRSLISSPSASFFFVEI